MSPKRGWAGGPLRVAPAGATGKSEAGAGAPKRTRKRVFASVPLQSTLALPAHAPHRPGERKRSGRFCDRSARNGEIAKLTGGGGGAKSTHRAPPVTNERLNEAESRARTPPSGKGL